MIQDLYKLFISFFRRIKAIISEFLDPSGEVLNLLISELIQKINDLGFVILVTFEKLWNNFSEVSKSIRSFAPCFVVENEAKPNAPRCP